MESTATQSNLQKFKLPSKRPDSMKLELLTIPENGCLNSFASVSSTVTVGFKDINYSVKEGIFKRTNKTLLDNVSGEFCAGELTAIMGPSGSGKTSLMNILAGYTAIGVKGTKLVNDEIREERAFRRQSCYILQDDYLHPLLTVQEAMNVAADLKMDQKFSQREKKSRIKEILDSMSLWNHRKSRTGSLSGGQKKRLSIALEFLKNPQVMFFDEPTSGLDSLTSKQIVMVLKELAMTGRNIICTIHQPSATIFELFDHLYVLAEGKCIYQGSVKGLVPYLEEVNLVCPEYHNPADYLLEVASGDYGNYTNVLCDKSENGLNHEWRKRQQDYLDLQSMRNIERMMESGQITPVHAPRTVFPKFNRCDSPENLNYCCRGSYPTSYCNQVSVLIRRTFLILTRDRTLTYSRLLTHITIGFFIGILYFGIGLDASNMLNNFNYMYFTVMFLMLTAFNCVSTTFPSELPIITREHFNKWYSLKSYYVAISLSDVPIQIVATVAYTLITYYLTYQPFEPYRMFSFMFICILVSLVAQSFGLFIGACMDIKNGVIFGPFCFLPFTIFSGFFVQLNDAPSYLRWIFHTSFLKYGLEGLVISVFGYDREKLPCEESDYCHFEYPKKFLIEMDMQYAKYSTAVIFLITLTVAIRLVGYYALWFRILWSRQRR